MKEYMKVTLEMLRKEAAEARAEAIKKQALPDGELKDACLQLLYAAKENLSNRAYGDTIAIRITGMLGNKQQYYVGRSIINLQCVPSIKDIRRVLVEVDSLVEEKCDKYSDTQILVRFA